MQEGNNPACTGFDGLSGIKFDNGMAPSLLLEPVACRAYRSNRCRPLQLKGPASWDQNARPTFTPNSSRLSLVLSATGESPSILYSVRV